MFAKTFTRAAMRAATPMTPTTLRMQRGFRSAVPVFAVRKAYTPQHEWISVDSDTKIGTVGITDYAQKALGDVVYVEVIEAGTEVEKGESVGAVESVKSASDIYAPVSGEVLEMNEVLADKPGNLNKGAESDGWLCKVKVTENYESELDALLDEAAYKAHCEGEEH
ncbi:glycine cleavage H-protein-domain-containing protein [Protomyces lactucae-debilis]|uniref:Glycine cleavage system H protein n=1 Tax=Protomyces lactucae-debilis TaxID=2754530 RepID=A0A1Y2FGP9_PROLT|nr:glycine cleavage H-protein-domain-containing protein [Protomyces lactucae-debilis]ORY83102.1 glycine cleavage H-protein-domain-containing protein [Protomyces lactucae-debilis]